MKVQAGLFFQLISLLIGPIHSFAQSSSPPPPQTAQLSSFHSDLFSRLVADGLALDRGGYYLSPDANALQGFTWGESYVMLAYLNAYEATLDPAWLNLFVKHADAVINQRDDRAPRNLREPVWGDRVPNLQGRTYGLTVDSGMITWPMARFAYLVKHHRLDNRFSLSVRRLYPELSRYGSFQAIATRYVLYVEETVRWHIRREYRELPGPLSATHLFKNRAVFMMPGIRGSFKPREETSPFFFDTAGRPMARFNQLPYNMQNCMGTTAAYLYDVTQKPEYLQVARGLLRNYFDALYPPAPYDVDYWGIETGTEDASHGWMNAEFLKAAHETGIGIPSIGPSLQNTPGLGLPSMVLTQYGRIATERLYTYTRPDPLPQTNPPSTPYPPHSWNYFYNAAASSKNNTSDIFRVYGMWSILGPFTPTLLDKASSLFRSKQSTYAPGDALAFLSLSLILRNSGNRAYGQACASDAQCTSGVCYGLSSNSPSGVCGNILGHGSTCGRNLECDSGLCISGTCARSQKADGSACARSQDCVSGDCTNGSCRAKALSGIGAACISDLNCVSGLCASGVCAQRFALGVGSTCSRNEECASNDCFDNKVCQNRLGNGSHCRTNNDCVSRACHENKICAAPMGGGSKCYQDEECVTGKCKITTFPDNELKQYWRPYGKCQTWLCVNLNIGC